MSVLIDAFPMIGTFCLQMNFVIRIVVIAALPAWSSWLPAAELVDPGGEEGYMEHYPGDRYVDVLGYDHYAQSAREAVESLRMVVKLAVERDKVPAFSEAGVKKGLVQSESAAYYTRELLEPISSDPVARRVAYVMVWRNSSEQVYWVPHPGDKRLEDFRKFYADPFTAFERDLPDMYMGSGRKK